MACAERFRKCTVGGFVNEILSSQAQQFAAVTIGLDDGTTYISFRGTDDTIVGWKEDFNLSNGVVPSHRKALGYLETHGTYIQSMLRIGGHSKGGNLAMYAAMQCSDILQEKLLSVYDNDGPGFPEGFSVGRVEGFAKSHSYHSRGICDQYAAQPPERSADRSQYTEGDPAA